MRKQKTDRLDAAHILKLLLENRFPRLWGPSAAERDLRQLLIHRHKLVGIRARAKNGLQHLMLNRGVQMKRKLWSEAGQKALRALPLEGWAAQRRRDLLHLLSGLNPQIGQLDVAIERAAQENPGAQLLMTQPVSLRSPLHYGGSMKSSAVSTEQQTHLFRRVGRAVRGTCFFEKSPYHKLPFG